MSSTYNMNIHETFFEDDLGDRYFFYNGKNNIIGLQYPDGVIINNNYQYIRVGYIRYAEYEQDKEYCIDETFDIRLENNSSDNSEYSRAVLVRVFGILKNGNIMKSTAKCNYTFLEKSQYESDVDIKITEETKTDSDGTYNVLSVWVKTENISRIFTTLVNSHALNTVPLTSYYVDNRYITYIINDENLQVDSDTCNLPSYLETMLVCDGVNNNKYLEDKITLLTDKIISIDMSYMEVNYDVGFEPIPTGEGSDIYQIVSPSSVSYSKASERSLSKISIDSSNRCVKILENGIYQIQMTSGIFVNDDNSSTGLIEMIPYINDTPITSLTLQYDPKMKINQLSTSLYTVELVENDTLYLKFKFLGDKGSDIRNNGFTYLKFTKVL